MSIARQLARLLSVLPPRLLLQPSASDTTTALIRCSSRFSRLLERAGMVAGGQAGRWETEVRMCDLLPGRLLPASCKRMRRGGKVEEKNIWRMFLFEHCSQVFRVLEVCAGRGGGEGELQESTTGQEPMKLLAQKLPKYNSICRSPKNTIQSAAAQNVQIWKKDNMNT